MTLTSPFSLGGAIAGLVITGFAAAGFFVRRVRFFFFCVPALARQMQKIRRLARPSFMNYETKPPSKWTPFQRLIKITLLLDAIKLEQDAWTFTNRGGVPFQKVWVAA